MAAPVAVGVFVDAANAYAAAVSADAGDPSLSAQLAALPALCADAINAIVAAGTTATAQTVADGVEACEVLLARCQSLGNAALAEAPPIVLWTVPEPLPLLAILSRFYGAAASGHVEEAFQNNPAILGLTVIPTGTVLRLAAV